MLSYDVSVRTWAEGQRNVRSTWGPMRFRMPLTQLPVGSFLSPRGNPRNQRLRRVHVAVFQPDRDLSNRTNLALFFFKDHRRARLPDSLVKPEYRWKQINSWYRSVKVSQDHTLDWRLSRRRIEAWKGDGTLFHPIPVGHFTGVLTLSHDSLAASDSALIELSHETEKVERPLVDEPRSRLILPDDYRREEPPALQPLPDR